MTAPISSRAPARAGAKKSREQHSISFKVSGADKKRVITRAAAAGMTVSNYARDAVLDRGTVASSNTAHEVAAAAREVIMHVHSFRLLRPEMFDLYRHEIEKLSATVTGLVRAVARLRP